MAKALITYCDIHLAREPEEYEIGATHRISIDSLRERTLDLCPDCEATVLADLLDVLRTHGQLIDGAKPRSPKMVDSKPAKATQPPRKASPSPAADVPRYQHLDDRGRRVETCLVCGKTYDANGISAHYTNTHKDVSRGALLLEHGLIDETFDCSECGTQLPTQQGRAQHEWRTHGTRRTSEQPAQLRLAD